MPRRGRHVRRATRAGEHRQVTSELVRGRERLTDVHPVSPKLGALGAALTAAVLTAGAVACASPERSASSSTAPLPDRITCGTQYRPDEESPDGAEQTTLAVARTDGVAAEATTHAFETLTIAVTYHGAAPEGRDVVIVVSTADGEVLHRALYQIGEPAIGAIHFAGGHGFTGLHYVHHAGAQLQFWCAA